MQEFINKAIDICTMAGGKLILALLVFLIGKAVINKLMKLLGKIKGFDRMDPTARSFLHNILKGVLYVVLIISIIGILGVPMASVVAVLASCGLAVGMAMQGALGNLAGGLMLLIFRPFNVGDYIMAGGEEGTVKSISLIYTILTTVDNKVVSVPNGSLMNATIKNLSAEENRRVDLTFNIGGDNAIEDVRSVILKTVSESEKVLMSPAPQIEPVAGIPGGLQYTVRVWTKSADYWDVYFEMMREIPTALGKAGIGGPSTPIKVNN